MYTIRIIHTQQTIRACITKNQDSLPPFKKKKKIVLLQCEALGLCSFIKMYCNVLCVPFCSYNVTE